MGNFFDRLQNERAYFCAEKNKAALKSEQLIEIKKRLEGGKTKCSVLGFMRSRGLSSEAWNSFLEYMKTDRKLSELNLDGVWLPNGQPWEALMHVVVSNTSLNVLDLSDNKPTRQETLEIVTAALTRNRTLTCLNMREWDLMSCAVEYLEAIVREHPVLTDVDVSSCGLTGNDVLRLLEAFARSTKFKRLDVRYPRMNNQLVSLPPEIEALVQLAAEGRKQELSDRLQHPKTVEALQRYRGGGEGEQKQDGERKEAKEREERPLRAELAKLFAELDLGDDVCAAFAARGAWVAQLPKLSAAELEQLVPKASDRARLFERIQSLATGAGAAASTSLA